MKAKRSLRLVIDADISRACGDSGSPRAAAASIFLNNVRSVCHHVVVTAAITREWDRHESGFFAKWRRAMANRGKIDEIEQPSSRRLRAQLRQVDLGTRQLQEALKDAHLLEAAQVADKIVCSFDVAALGYFRRVCDRAEWVGEIAWVSPDEHPDALLQKALTKIKTARFLGTK